ncbi:glycoside hydrolase family 3 N-terminal domain-containing protein [Flavobacterium sp.]|uniref:glycoside hydrolase family 3 N-terminal domain-containing protein n=1 Tax=Flavobacterium sp. TaxID=239 RepID=UPI0025D10693|nr:glycoside hydrolase family 3 N-terminal domain-containing protein [Flavobacterium sp.]
MKTFLLRTGLYLSLLFLVANCGIIKNKFLTHSKVTLQKPEISDFEEVYIPQLKSERKNFFKDSDAETHWVDSIYGQMTLEEKVGQLFMVAAYSNKDTTHTNAIEKLIRNQKIGGVIFFQGGPLRQANLTNRYQSKSKVPLFVGIDAEWGLSMRLDSTYRYPWNMTLGAIKDLKLIEKVGELMGKESNRMGVHFNFAPVLDINTNPKNPIIGNRSFGENKVNVTEKAIALMNGVQNQGVFSTGKHFPGHGDTAIDSHLGLPTVTSSREHLDVVELYPYKRMFDEGLVSVMVGHLDVPSLEFRQNFPSSISYNVVTNLLQKELEFDGLIFTDALNMKGISKYRKPGELELDALLAGNDILLFPENVPLAVETISKAYQENALSEERLALSIKKILKYKFKAGLNHYKSIAIPNLISDINPVENEALQYQLYENATTVLKNGGDILPIKDLVNNKIAYVKLGDDTNASFISTLKKYADVTEVTAPTIDSLNVKLKEFSTVIVGYHKADKPWKNNDFTSNELIWLQEIARNNRVILDVFAKPYSLLPLANYTEIEGLIVSYQNNDIAQQVGAELIFGAIEAKGKLPVSINDNFKVNDGLSTDKLNRLGFTAPENVGMSSVKLTKIDALVQKAITGKMTPGAQVVVARKGKVIYQKAFGNYTYDSDVKVTNETIFDVASVSKIIGTLPNVMQQYDQQKVNLESTLGSMVPIFANSDKKDIRFKELLSHYAGLVSWVPFYKATLDAKDKPLAKYYRKIADSQFSKQVADSLFIRNDYHDTIMKIIVDSKLSVKKEYKYSDFTFIILGNYLERLTGKTLDVLATEQFFKPLGATNTFYNPLQKIDKNQIAPTEIDSYFRHQKIQGYVHDMAAAIEGGVAGHAGVFSNAMDIAKIMQMYLQKGNYGNQHYFSTKTFDDFNTCYFCAEGNRRGLGFDKPQLSGDSPTCGCVSKSSFGHTGFTGIIAWADPVTEIVYVFISNRTYPTNPVNILSKEHIREDIQKVISEAIIN